MWWLAGALLLGVIEMLTLDFIFLMLAGGALAAVFAAMLGAPPGIQVVVFAVTSVLMLFAVRPHIKRWVKHTTPDILTNAQALIGAEGHTLLEVTEDGGRIKMRGEVWTARTAIPGDIIPPDTDVVVTQIDGAIAVVTRPQPQY